MSRKTRKLIWSVPLVAVFAVVGALAHSVTLGPTACSRTNVEHAAGHLTMEPASGKQSRATDALVLTGTAPRPMRRRPPTGYRIDVLRQTATSTSSALEWTHRPTLTHLHPLDRMTSPMRRRGTTGSSR